MKSNLRSVRLPSTEPLEKPQVEKPSLLNRKFQYNPAASHSDPNYMTNRMAHYARIEKERAK